eukprot:208306-Prymnesium_polylepis.1
MVSAVRRDWRSWLHAQVESERGPRKKAGVGACAWLIDVRARAARATRRPEHTAREHRSCCRCTISSVSRRRSSVDIPAGAAGGCGCVCGCAFVRKEDRVRRGTRR